VSIIPLVYFTFCNGIAPIAIIFGVFILPLADFIIS
jgi:hypothetical protein